MKALKSLKKKGGFYCKLAFVHMTLAFSRIAHSCICQTKGRKDLVEGTSREHISLLTGQSVSACFGQIALEGL